MKSLRQYRALSILIVLMLFPFLLTYLGLDLVAFLEEIRENEKIALFFTIPLHIILSVSPMGSEPVALANGFIYGIYLGSLVNWIGSLTGSIVGYWLIYQGAEEANLSRYMKKLPPFIRNIPVSSPLFLIGVRFIPFVGSDIVKYVAPMWKVPFGRYLWTSAVAIFPIAIFMAALGSGATFLIDYVNKYWF
ncbi:VTT domain-containing protein [Heliorestis acidaminivorans]|uniref:TVP38/TMEM64 family membrane protein n=1 Tax=Heliorestis acidaminivorans TaxID=553427 RepID=A0A6I0EYJ7_9FIRM|nr:VTT domain-containing protein [Heliorestis acidaminivorans]KAB2952390.1 VTT domain-containing protein [Heliorestis acidaminivorans]